MKEAYLETIKDFEIALRNCGLFEFRRQHKYEKLIKEYEDKLDNKE